MSSFVCDYALRPSQQFISHVGTISYLPGFTYGSSKQMIKCLAEGHKTVYPVSLKPATLDLHSNTLPLIKPLTPHKKKSSLNNSRQLSTEFGRQYPRA